MPNLTVIQLPMRSHIRNNSGRLDAESHGRGQRSGGWVRS